MRIACRTATFAALIIASSAAGCGSAAKHSVARSHNATKTESVTPITTANPTIGQVHENLRQPVVTIAGKPITLGVLRHWILTSVHPEVEVPEPPGYKACIEHLRAAASTTTKYTTEELKDTCRRQYDKSFIPALRLLIHAHWLIDEAANEGLRVDQERLRREATVNGPRGEEVRGILARKGATISDVRFRLMLNELSERIYRKLEAKVPTVTPAQISKYYKRHKQRYVIPEKRDLYVVRTASDAEATKAKRELEGGTSFATIVKKSTLVQPETSQGGLLLGLSPRTWPEQPLSREVFRAPLKTLRGPVKISLGYYVFEVIRRTPPRQSTLTEARSEIATQLHELRRDQILSRFVAAFRKRWRPRTSCRPGYVVIQCKQHKGSEVEFEASPAVL